MEQIERFDGIIIRFVEQRCLGYQGVDFRPVFRHFAETSEGKKTLYTVGDSSHKEFRSIETTYYLECPHIDRWNEATNASTRHDHETP